MKRIFTGIFSALIFTSVIVVNPAFADSYSTNFESPAFTTGSISGQSGWSNAVNPSYDQSIVTNTYGYASFGGQSFRMSDAVTSGSFGDWVFAKPLTDSVGETTATADGFSVGTRQTHFEMQFDIASTLSTQQPGLHVSVSPDRGDGSRMSYLRFEDGTSGIDVFFDDVQQTVSCTPSGCANFVETKIASGLNRTVPHTIKLTLDVLDGPNNDVVKVWIDGSLVHTGTSWEDYYLYDPEASAEQSPRIVKTVIFQSRTGSGPVTNPADSGNGFLFDNFSMSSSTPYELSVPKILTPPNGAIVTSAALVKVDWTDATGTFPPFTYQYEAYSDPGYTALIYDSGMSLSASEIPTPGTPDGIYYVRVRAKDSMGNVSDWSNGSSDPYKITVSEVTPTPTPTPIGPPTNKDQCKKDGWKVFNNPKFKNQGECVEYVEKHKDKPGKAWGFARYYQPGYYMVFNVEEGKNGKPAKGNIWNITPDRSFYQGDVKCAQIDGNTAYFAAKIDMTNNNSFGPWVLIKVLDGGKTGDKVWGQFVTESVAQSWCLSPTDPTGGPWNVLMGNLVVSD